MLQLYGGFSVRGNSEETLVAETFTWPLGEWMVILSGLGLLGFAVYQIFRAATTKLGIAARGIVFGIVAWYLIQTGITGRASKTAGSADAIRVVANWPEPLGSWLLAGVG